ncbi:MAG TPA: hypothetical protein VLB32_05930, partial [Candidatus Acidoferrales bacterium]|nr:hypothetical protein [Candidatus Acidoferrales bacterium]
THSSDISETVPDALRQCANPDCEVEFVPLRPWHRYHTPACRARHWNRAKKATPAKTASAAPRRYIIHCVVEVE